MAEIQNCDSYILLIIPECYLLWISSVEARSIIGLNNCQGEKKSPPSKLKTI
jgi:hypothetical protein